MKIKVEMELNDAMNIIAAFTSENKQTISDTIKRKGEAALQRMEAQVDKIVENIDNCDEATFT